MMAKIYILSLLVLCSSLGFAQTENSLLWKISGNGLSQPSYLFGTIHLLPKDKFEINEKVLNAMQNSKTLVTEISLDIPLSQQIEIAKEMFLPEKKTYEDYISGDEYEFVYHYMLDSLDIKKRKIKRIIRIKPFFASGLMLKEYYGKIKSFEIELKKLAKKHDMRFGALETLDEQLKLVNDMTLDEQFENIQEDITSIHEFDKMITCYLHEDLDCLKEMVFMKDDADDFVDVFLYARNEKWIPVIESFISKDAAFFAVGAGHLLGEKGVIALLQNKGYTVTPVFLVNL